MSRAMQTVRLRIVMARPTYADALRETLDQFEDFPGEVWEEPVGEIETLRRERNQAQNEVRRLTNELYRVTNAGAR